MNLQFNLSVGEYYFKKTLVSHEIRHNIFTKENTEIFKFLEEDGSICFKGDYQETQEFLNDLLEEFMKAMTK